LTPSLGPVSMPALQMEIVYAPLCQSSPPSSPRQHTLPRTSSYGGEVRPQRQPPLVSGATKAQQEKLKRALPSDLLHLFEGGIEGNGSAQTNALIDATLCGAAASSCRSPQASRPPTSQQAEETGISPDVQGYGTPDVYHRWRVEGKKNAGL